MRLMKFTYTISHVPGKHIATTDVLSRAPGEEKRDKDQQQNEEELNLYVNSVVTSLPATEKRLHEIQQHQEADPVLQLVKKYTLEGWPTKSRVEAMVLPYFQFAGELTVENGLLLKGCRLVIPKSLQSDILEKLHSAHQGIAKCRERAKQSVWWPGLSAQLQQKVEKCDICASHRKIFKETLIPTEFPDRPWSKVGADLFQWKDDQYLLVIDYFSRFMEIAKLSSTTAACVVTHLKSIFARHGIPTEVMSDNGPQFSAEYFKKFAKEWGFSHTTSSPRYPQANGEAERAVRTVKEFLSKAADPYLALMEYRATPLANGHSPAELLMGRKLRTTVPGIPSVLNPGWVDLNRLKEEEMVRREKQGKQFNKRHRAHVPGESVWIGDTGEKGTVIRLAETPRSYLVESPKGILRRNRSHLVPTPVAPPAITSECTLPPEQENTASAVGPDVLCSYNVPGLPNTPEKRYPSRERKPPKYLKDFVYS
ncbi:hypothetical protein QQF64_013604 [Cirrhinus molitorella]|uniref:Gypsy retrotransposon integrase-like protein 1 n=1 Tax=Cirrhinus molitorella TaxID=172907 RepID=A0ABR3LVT5_9TELE